MASIESDPLAVDTCSRSSEQLVRFLVTSELHPDLVEDPVGV